MPVMELDTGDLSIITEMRGVEEGEWSTNLVKQGGEGVNMCRNDECGTACLVQWAVVKWGAAYSSLRGTNGKVEICSNRSKSPGEGAVLSKLGQKTQWNGSRGWLSRAVPCLSPLFLQNHIPFSIILVLFAKLISACSRLSSFWHIQQHVFSFKSC